MGISLYRGSVGQPGVGSSTETFEIWLKGALGMECLSLWGSVKGTWRGGGFLSGDPEAHLEKALETGTSLYRGSASGEPGGRLFYRGL
jgi:hypothetical protein